MLDVGLEPLVEHRLPVAMQGDDLHVEGRPKIRNDALEVLEGHDPASIDEVVLLVALRAIYATKVTGVDGLDREEDGLTPHPIALEQVAEASGDPGQVPEI